MMESNKPFQRVAKKDTIWNGTAIGAAAGGAATGGLMATGAMIGHREGNVSIKKMGGPKRAAAIAGGVGLLAGAISGGAMGATIDAIKK